MGSEKSTGRSSLSHFPQAIANKVSPASVYPTVVHRPRKRPSVARLNNHAPPSPPVVQMVPQASPDTNNSSNPSNYYNSTSPTSQTSTAKTSLFSDLTSPQSADSRRSFKKYEIESKQMSTEPFEDALSTIEEARTSESKTLPIEFSTQDAPSFLEPSISSIEKIAATKAYFEMHYNDILNSPLEISRAKRRQELERTLSSRAMSLADRQKVRYDWAQAESNNLRQTRVLKSRSLLRQDSKGILVAGYEQVRILGKGSFGVVKLVRERQQERENAPTPTGTSINSSSTRSCVGMDGATLKARDEIKDVFAMKVIRKSDMLRNCQEGHLRAERDFLIASQHSPWVVPLIASFQDSSNLYLVMEYMVGGDFLGLLLREDVLDEYVAKWYLAEMVLCIEETHKLRWIHRDVKPDNFLIHSDGHLKISDFGLAFDGHWAHNQSYYKTHRYDLIEKFGIEIEGDDQDKDDQRSSTSESPSRLSNILRRDSRKRYDQQVVEDEIRQEAILDHRNRRERRRMANSVVGTMVQCLYGCTPFFCENRNDTKLRILKHSTELRFPSGDRWARPTSEYKQLLDPPSWEAQDFIWKLLQTRHSRLGSRRYVINDLRMPLRTSSSPAKFRDRERDRDSAPGGATGSAGSAGATHLGSYVFPHDADEIKAHPFFAEIPWARLPTQRPPFVPEVRPDQSITKYFESEKDIISEGDVEDGESGVDSEERERRGKSKEKKRPRDKLLRDPVLGRTVLEVRKRNAFLGYTYRRPKPWVL
ncbi:MAG: hypothetical protein Q9157_009083, partial [Trypethelium eluteriae]